MYRQGIKIVFSSCSLLPPLSFLLPPFLTELCPLTAGMPPTADLQMSELVYVHNAYGSLQTLCADTVVVLWQTLFICWQTLFCLCSNNGRGSPAACMRGRSSAKQSSATISECVRYFGEPVRWLAYRTQGGGATSLLEWGVCQQLPTVPIFHSQNLVSVHSSQIYCFNHTKNIRATLSLVNSCTSLY